MSVALLLTFMFASPTVEAQATYTFAGTTAVGQSSPPVSVTVALTESGAPATTDALTLGISNAEFVVNGGTCTAGNSYGPGQQCGATVVFQPKYPGLRSGAVVLKDSSGNVLGVALIAGVATGPLPVLTPGTITTVAGLYGSWIYTGDRVPAIGAPIQLPAGVVADAAGTLYVSDTENFRIRKVTAAGDISTIAGTGSAGYSGDGGQATQAMISLPAGLALDGAGDLYFADTGNNIIRRIDAFSGVITTVAGTPGSQGYWGDGSAATNAQLTSPEGIALDGAGDLLIADTGNNRIREVNAAGIISTLAGNGVAGFSGDGFAATTAELHSPWSVAVAGAVPGAQDGSLYIADLGNSRVREVNPSGIISTIAGGGTSGMGDGGAATAAKLNEPTALAIDPAGDLYIADSENNRVREISASTGIIETIVGTGEVAQDAMDLGDGGSATAANIYGPYALYFDQNGNLFVADRFDNLIRKITGLAISLNYATIKVGNVSPPQVVVLANDGNANLVLTDLTPVEAATSPSPTTTCTTVAPILSAGTCTIGAEFAPTVISDPVDSPVLGTITVNSQGSTTAPVINLSGIVLNVTPTTVALTSSVSPSLVGESVTFTATVTSDGTPLTGLTGTITVLLNGGTVICGAVTVTGSGIASCSTSTLALGTNNITAEYSGDPNDEANTSPVWSQVVKQMPTLTLAATPPSPVVVTSNVTLTFTAAPPAGSSTGTPTGTATFYDGTTALSAATPLSSGVATFSTTQLSIATHNLSAQYAGDASNASGPSNVVQESVQQATTTTVLSTSSSASEVGASVTLTATVTSANGPTPVGTVEFMSGSSDLGNGTIGSDGTATLSLSSLAPGSYAIVAIYSGDTDDATSTSTALVETIQQIPTATTLTSNANPIFAGATLNLSVAVAATGSSINGGTLSGNVTFSEGATVYGIVAINSAGSAILPLTTLPAGSHSILASYAGNTNYAASTSAVLNEFVQSTATTTTLSSPAAMTLAGEPASFTAIVSSTTATPSGPVTFEDGGLHIGQALLNAQGVAAFSTTSLSVGSHSITAVYLGNPDYNSSTSAAMQHTVVLATSSLVLSGPATAVNAGTTFAMVSTLSSNGVAPSGTMTLHNGGATIATQSVSTDGTFTFPNLSLGVGTYQLTAAYSGDANNAAAVSAPFLLPVQLTPTVTSLISSANPSTLGAGVTFTASAMGGTPAPTGLIDFMDGVTALGSSPMSANGVSTLSVSALAFGTHSITARYAGDRDHAISTSAAVNEKIVEPASASLSSSLNPSIFGSSVVFTVTITGVASQVPTGQVVVRFGASTLGTVTLDATGTGTLQTSALQVGSDILTASYGGDTNYSTISASLTQTVQSATTQVLLAASQNPAIYGTPITFTATITGNGGVVQAGAVNFTDAGAFIGSATLNSNGIAILTLATLIPGTHSIVANYGGNGNISPSSTTPLLLLVKDLTSVVLASSENPTSTLSAIVLTAAVRNSGVGEPTGTITFVDGSNQLGVATLSANGMASLTVPSLSAGNHSVTATYVGDNQNFTSISPALTEGVQLRPTTSALSGSPTDPTNPLQITLISVVNWSGPVSPTGMVTFTAGTTLLGSSPVNSIGVATLDVTLSSSTESIVAAYSGDASYAASNSLATSISGGIATQITMQLSPSSLTFQSKQHGIANVAIISLGGFADTLQLGCLGLPEAATCTFSTPQIKLTANGTVTVLLTVDTGNPLGAGSLAKLKKQSNSGVLLCLLPCLLGLRLGTRRKKFKGSSLLIILCMLSLTTLLSGCSGLSTQGTPAGTYTFKVTASGVGGGATVSQTMTLTVTP